MRTTEDRVVIRPLPKEEISAGGIFIPEGATGKPTKGEVLMIGDDAKIKCIPGDHILFPEHAGFDFSWDGVDLKVIRWADIQMILDKEVKSGQEIIKTDNYVSVDIMQILNAGMTNETFVLNINGNEFHLRGNVLMPVVKEKEPATNGTL